MTKQGWWALGGMAAVLLLCMGYMIGTMPQKTVPSVMPEASAAPVLATLAPAEGQAAEDTQTALPIPEAKVEEVDAEESKADIDCKPKKTRDAQLQAASFVGRKRACA